jgi:16S rRNA (cytosine1402-N4)-methyltransferase
LDSRAFAHRPVLAAELIEALRPAPGRRYVDATVGGGGHAERLLEAGASVLGIDRDETALAASAARLARFGDRVRLVRGRFGDLEAIAAAERVAAVDGVVADLGVSSPQLDEPGRGFSFQREGPLDMRMDRRDELTAADLVNRLPPDELAALIRELGEERWAGPIARRIARARQEGSIETTGRLAEVVAAAVAAAERRRGRRPRAAQRIHPATRTFQALRMRVNDELGQLERLLAAAPGLLAQGGRLAVISFHSLEDRLVKEAVRRESAGCRCPPEWPVCRCGGVGRLRAVTRKPVTAGEAEIEANPRARSAKLRVAERI